MTILTATERAAKATKSELGKSRAAGQVPAVIYGNGQQQRFVFLPGRELNRLLNQAESRNLQLKIGDKETVSVRIQEVQRHTVSTDVTHVDLIYA